MSWIQYIAQNSGALLMLSIAGLALMILVWWWDETQEKTIRVLGYDPRSRQMEYRECELEGEHAIWEREEADNIRFVPKSETLHDTPDGPAWILDVTDGRTMAVNESEETVRTSGQELEKAVRDDTIQQALDIQPGEYEFYLRALTIMGPIIILLLLVFLAIQFGGSL